MVEDGGVLRMVVVVCGRWEDDDDGGGVCMHMRMQLQRGAGRS